MVLGPHLGNRRRRGCYGRLGREDLIGHSDRDHRRRDRAEAAAQLPVSCLVVVREEAIWETRTLPKKLLGSRNVFPNPRLGVNSAETIQ